MTLKAKAFLIPPARFSERSASKSPGAGRVEADRRQALLRQRFHVYAGGYLNALAEVERALIAETWQEDAVTSIERQLKLARDTPTRLTGEYLNGTTEFLRVLAAQQSVQTLESDWLTARRELIEARVSLSRALSGGWDLAACPPPAVIEVSQDSHPFPIAILRGDE